FEQLETAPGVLTIDLDQGLGLARQHLLAQGRNAAVVRSFRAPVIGLRRFGEDLDEQPAGHTTPDHSFQNPVTLALGYDLGRGRAGATARGEARGAAGRRPARAPRGALRLSGYWGAAPGQ